VLRAYGDGRLFGEAYGDGPVGVLWLHGWGRSSKDFNGAALELARSGVASVALDLPGFGASPAPAAAGGAHLYAAAVAPVLASFAPTPVVVVGHSFGGVVATVLAAEHPTNLRALVLTGSPLLRRATAAATPGRYRVLRALHRRGLVGEARMEAARQRYGSRDYRAAQGVMRDVLVATVNERYEADMARVAVPVWLLWGDDDTEVPLAIAERARGYFSAGVSLRVLDDVAHFVPTEAPLELVSVVREAIA
jgi:pimeloyl-ACP methyl ester carboxylesterase